MKRKARKNPFDEHEIYDEINVVPMLDLAWNLLLVFMIVVTASVQGISVNLPKASAAASKVKSDDKGDHDNRGRDHLSRQLSRNAGRAGRQASAVQGRGPQFPGGDPGG